MYIDFLKHIQGYKTQEVWGGGGRLIKINQEKFDWNII